MARLPRVVVLLVGALVVAAQPRTDTVALANGDTVSAFGLDWKVRGDSNKRLGETLEVAGYYYSGAVSEIESKKTFDRPIVVEISEKIPDAVNPSECLGLQIFPPSSCQSHLCGHVIGIGWWADSVGVYDTSGGLVRFRVADTGTDGNWRTWKTTRVELLADGTNKYYINGKLLRTTRTSVMSGKLRFKGCQTGDYANLTINGSSLLEGSSTSTSSTTTASTTRSTTTSSTTLSTTSLTSTSSTATSTTSSSTNSSSTATSTTVSSTTSSSTATHTSITTSSTTTSSSSRSSTTSSTTSSSKTNSSTTSSTTSSSSTKSSTTSSTTSSSSTRSSTTLSTTTSSSTPTTTTTTTAKRSFHTWLQLVRLAKRLAGTCRRRPRSCKKVHREAVAGFELAEAVKVYKLVRQFLRHEKIGLAGGTSEPNDVTRLYGLSPGALSEPALSSSGMAAAMVSIGAATSLFAFLALAWRRFAKQGVAPETRQMTLRAESGVLASTSLAERRALLSLD